MINTTSRPVMPRRELWLSALVLFAVALWLTIHWPHNSFWYDEALTTWVATDSWESLLLWCTQVDIQVPLHYVVLRLWASVAGNSEFTLRLLSAFCVLLAVAGIMSAARRAAKSHSAGWAAALVLGTLPGMIWLGFEVRAYALALALYAWATVFLVALIEPSSRTNRRWQIVGYSLLMIATLYTHYTAIAGLFAHFAILALAGLIRRSRQLLVTLLTSGVLIAIGFAPWLPTMLTRGAADRSYYVGQPITPDHAVEVMLGFKLVGREDAPSVAMPFVITYAGLMIVGALFSLRRSRWVGALVGGLIAITPIVVTAALVYFKPKLAGRYVWPAWIGFDVLTGLLVAEISRRTRLVGVLTLAALIAFPWLIGERGHPPDSDFRAAYAYICAQGDPNDVILLRDGTLFVVHAYYGRRSPCDTERYSISSPVAAMTNVEQALTYPVAHSAIQEVIKRQPPNVWVVAWQGDVMDPQALSYGLLDNVADHTLIGQLFGDVRVDRYERLQSLDADPTSSGKVIDITPVPNGPTLQRINVIAPETVKAGDVITVQAWWIRGEALQPDLRVSPRITTLDGGWTYTQVDQPPSSWKYVDDRWTKNEPILGRYELVIGPDVPAGKIAIRYVIYDAAGRWEPIVLKIGELNVVKP